MFTYRILHNGREIENLDPGAYLTAAAAEECGTSRLDDLCPPLSPSRQYYRVEVLPASITEQQVREITDEMTGDMEYTADAAEIVRQLPITLSECAAGARPETLADLVRLAMHDVYRAARADR